MIGDSICRGVKYSVMVNQSAMFNLDMDKSSTIRALNRE